MSRPAAFCAGRLENTKTIEILALVTGVNHTINLCLKGIH